MLWDNLSSSDKKFREEAQLVAEQSMLLQGRDKYWREYNRAPDAATP